MLMLVGLIFTWNPKETYAQGSYNRKLQLSPSSGYEGTNVEVTMDVSAYFESIGSSNMIPYYLHKSYLLVWDPLGRSNQEDPAAFYTPHNLYLIGTATIDENGFLSGTATIPWVGSQSYGEHYIYAVYTENSGADNYLEWWWAPFNYVAQPANRYTVDVTIEPAGAGSATISPDESSYIDGTAITLTAHPNYGWTFYFWSGDVVSSYNPKMFYIASKNYHITANFVQNYDDSTPTPTARPICIIATAAYGSSLAPEVTFMRHVRDDLIGSNDIGKSIVKGWNTFYYSWSPPIARVISSSNQLRSVTAILLLPLLGTMHVTELQYNLLSANPELASVISFTTAAIMSIAIYIAFPVWLIYSLLKPKSWLNQKIRHRA